MDSPVFQSLTLLLLLVALGSIGFVLMRLIRSQKDQALPGLTAELAELRDQQASIVKTLHEGQIKNLEMFQTQFKGMVDTLHSQSQASQVNITGHMSRTGDTLNKVHAQLAGLAKTADTMTAIGGDVNRLHDLLKAPKLRGNLGEVLLENLLKQVLPHDCYVLQHHFKDGTIVDAAVLLGDSIVPIDSKFPLDEFQRAGDAKDEDAKRKHLRRFYAGVRKQVVDIATKYICPAEGTYDFALMYIPSESVYYQIITADESETNVLHEALQRKVIPVSPNTFYAYLMVISYGLKGMRIESEAAQVRAQLGALEATVNAFYESFQTLGKHLGNAQNKYNDADRAAAKLGDQIAGASRRTEGLSSDSDKPLLKEGGKG